MRATLLAAGLVLALWASGCRSASQPQFRAPLTPPAPPPPATTQPTSTTTTATTTQPTITITPNGLWTPVRTANFAVSPGGSDRTCGPHRPAVAPALITNPCATMDRANQLAHGGDVVAVMGGTYPADGLRRIDSNRNDIGGDATLLINDNSRSSDATFACGDRNPVTTQGRYLLFVTQHLTITGGCFRFRKVIMGDYMTGYFPAGKACTNETIDGGASMQVFDILGPCNNITISDSSIGPSVACYAPGSPASCRTTDVTGERYYHDRGIGNDDCCTEPKVHNGGYDGSITPHDITIGPGDRFWGFSSRDPDGLYGGGPHAGCLWLGWNDTSGSANVTVKDDTFSECMTYDIHIDFPPSRGLTITGNRFSRPKDAIRLLPNFDGIVDLPRGWVDVEVKCRDGASWPSLTMTDNTFSVNGYDLDYGGCVNQSYPGLVISRNTIPAGARNIPPQPQPSDDAGGFRRVSRAAAARPRARAGSASGAARRRSR